VLVDYESNAMEIQPLSSDAIPVAKGEIINLNSALALTQSTVNKVASNDMTSKLSWRKGNLIFRGDSLAEAIKEISRYTDISFELADDEALRDIKVAGMFKTGDIAALLSMLEKSFNIEHKKVDEQTIMLSLKS
jgi:transmembrane sensor